MTPKTIVNFWIEAGPKSWFAKDDAFDADLRTHFEAAHLADRAAVINGGRIVDMGTIDEIGGTEARVPVVRWNDGGTKREQRTHEPAALVAKLHTDLGREPEGLEVIRPSLEDIYLDLVGASRADDLNTEAALA